MRYKIGMMFKCCVCATLLLTMLSGCTTNKSRNKPVKPCASIVDIIVFKACGERVPVNDERRIRAI
jgi:hypothetical protein